MAVCLPSLSDLRAEPTLMEINQELRLQLAKCKQDFRDLTEKFLISQATAYSLANQLQKYSKSLKSWSPKQWVITVFPLRNCKSPGLVSISLDHFEFHPDHNPGKVVVALLPSVSWGWENGGTRSGGLFHVCSDVQGEIRVKIPDSDSWCRHRSVCVSQEQTKLCWLESFLFYIWSCMTPGWMSGTNELLQFKVLWGSIGKALC